MIQVGYEADWETVTIFSPNQRLVATFVPAQGGVMSSLCLHDSQRRELLYQHGTFWDQKLMDLPGGLPFLFPICGRLFSAGQMGRYVLDGRSYQLPIHGFSWQQAWQYQIESMNCVILRLQDNEQTRLAYPFSFEIELLYCVTDNALVCDMSVTNRSDEPMPFYAGFHPYFLTPSVAAGKAGMMLHYQPTHCYAYNDTFTDIVSELTVPNMPVSITEPGLSEMLTEVGLMNQVALHYPDGLQLVLTSGSDLGRANYFPYIQLYTDKTKPFFCVEPWMGRPNDLNRLDQLHWLLPGVTERAWMRLTLAQADIARGRRAAELAQKFEL